MKRKCLALLLVLALLFPLYHVEALAAPGAAENYIVSFKTPAAKEKIVKDKTKGKKVKKSFNRQPALAMSLTGQELTELRASGEVAFIEPDCPVEILSVGKADKARGGAKLRNYYSTTGVHARLAFSKNVPAIALNSYEDVKTGQGGHAVYKFTPAASGDYRIYTDWYGGADNGAYHDTYLELYADYGLTSRLAYDSGQGANRRGLDIAVQYASDADDLENQTRSWTAHFYGPGKSSYNGSTTDTAYHRYNNHYYNAVWNYQNGNKFMAYRELGMAMHYMSDMNQPHHAANRIAIISWHLWYENWVGNALGAYLITTAPADSYEYMKTHTFREMSDNWTALASYGFHKAS